MRDIQTMSPRQILERAIDAEGGYVNAHAHIDRSHIITPDNWHKTGDSLQQKWDYTDHFKRNASVGTILSHMSRVVEDQLEQGVQALGSFIDCDSVVRDKNIVAAERLRERYGDDIQLVFMNQPIKGLMDKKELQWFDLASQFVDAIGGLPERDGHEDPAQDKSIEHLDIIFDIAAHYNKPLHIHADQLNSPTQRDTEKILRHIKARKMIGKVTLIHCISLAAQQKEYRERIYRELKELDVTVVSCPSAWIDSRRNEVLAPTHNASTPVDEMVDAGVRVAIGSDNIADIYKPFSDGNMWTELRFLLEANHIYDIDTLAKIATTHGLRSLELEQDTAETTQLVA